MSRFRRSSRVAIALGVLLLSGQIWFVLALYLGLEQMGGRAHPVVDGFSWGVVAVAIAAGVVLCVEVFGSVLRRLSRRSHERQ